MSFERARDAVVRVVTGSRDASPAATRRTFIASSSPRSRSVSVGGTGVATNAAAAGVGADATGDAVTEGAIAGTAGAGVALGDATDSVGAEADVAVTAGVGTVTAAPRTDAPPGSGFDCAVGTAAKATGSTGTDSDRDEGTTAGR